MNSIGLVEVKNVSKGIVVTDEMLKSAGIVLISSGSVCPGKFVTIVGGELSAIHAAVDRAELIAEDALIDKFVIGNLGDNVFEAICGTADVKEKKHSVLLKHLLPQVQFKQPTLLLKPVTSNLSKFVWLVVWAVSALFQ